MFSIDGEFPDTRGSNGNYVLIPTDSELIPEFRSISQSLWASNDLSANAKHFPLGRKDTTIATAKITHQKIFDDLLAVLRYPANGNKNSLTNLITEIRDGLVMVFGKNLAGIYRLNDWLLTAQKSEPKNFNRHAGVAKIRDFFPHNGEIDAHTYQAWGLEKTDDAILKGIPDWTERPSTSKEQNTDERISPYYSAGIMSYHRAQN
jgi:hypothetical protein